MAKQTNDKSNSNYYLNKLLSVLKDVGLLPDNNEGERLPWGLAKKLAKGLASAGISLTRAKHYRGTSIENDGQSEDHKETNKTTHPLDETAKRIRGRIHSILSDEQLNRYGPKYMAEVSGLNPYYIHHIAGDSKEKIHMRPETLERITAGLCKVLEANNQHYRVEELTKAIREYNDHHIAGIKNPAPNNRNIEVVEVVKTEASTEERTEVQKRRDTCIKHLLKPGERRLNLKDIERNTALTYMALIQTFGDVHTLHQMREGTLKTRALELSNYMRDILKKSQPEIDQFNQDFKKYNNAIAVALGKDSKENPNVTNIRKRHGANPFAIKHWNPERDLQDPDKKLVYQAWINENMREHNFTRRNVSESLGLSFSITDDVLNARNLSKQEDDMLERLFKRNVSKTTVVGAILVNNRNKFRVTTGKVALATEIPSERLKEIFSNSAKPTIEETEKLIVALDINPLEANRLRGASVSEGAIQEKVFKTR